MEIEFENIPKHGFNVIKQSTDRMILRVEAFMSGTITLSPFSIDQILSGTEHETEFKNEDATHIPREFFKVYVKLNNAMRATLTAQKFPATIEFEITRSELLVMIRFLKARMAHCELERDQRNERFNADTYIGQKLLLLELTTLAMGTLVA